MSNTTSLSERVRPLTTETIRNVGFEDDATEYGWQREREVAFRAERYVAVPSLKTVQRQDALTNHLARLIVHCNPQHCQIWQHNLKATSSLISRLKFKGMEALLCNLSEDKRFFVVHRIETIVGNSSRSEFFSDCVGGKTVHVDLDVRACLLVRQELTCNVSPQSL